jgi:hypothetical protein
MNTKTTCWMTHAVSGRGIWLAAAVALAGVGPVVAQPAHPASPAAQHAPSPPRSPGTDRSAEGRSPSAGNTAPSQATTQAGPPVLDTQGPIRHGPPPEVQRDRRHLRAGYWLRYGPGSRRGDGSATVRSSGDPGTGVFPPAPSAVQATHNYDGSVTVTWALPAGEAALGDVYQVGRRLPGQGDFWLLGETTVPRFTDRSLPPRPTNAQYQIVVRRGGPEGRGGVYGPVSAIASANLNHPWATTAAPQSVPPQQAPGTPATTPSPPVRDGASGKKPAQSKTPSPPKDKP